MITTDSARWAGVKISFNFPRWRLGFEMVGLNLFRYNNVVESIPIGALFRVFKEDAMRGVERVTLSMQMKVEQIVTSLSSAPSSSLSKRPNIPL